MIKLDDLARIHVEAMVGRAGQDRTRVCVNVLIEEPGNIARWIEHAAYVDRSDPAARAGLGELYSAIISCALPWPFDSARDICITNALSLSETVGDEYVLLQIEGDKDAND